MLFVDRQKMALSPKHRDDIPTCRGTERMPCGSECLPKFLQVLERFIQRPAEEPVVSCMHDQVFRSLQLDIRAVRHGEHELQFELVMRGVASALGGSMLQVVQEVLRLAWSNRLDPFVLGRERPLDERSVSVIGRLLCGYDDPPDAVIDLHGVDAVLAKRGFGRPVGIQGSIERQPERQLVLPASGYSRFDDLARRAIQDMEVIHGLDVRLEFRIKSLESLFGVCRRIFPSGNPSCVVRDVSLGSVPNKCSNSFLRIRFAGFLSAGLVCVHVDSILR